MFRVLFEVPSGLSLKSLKFFQGWVCSAFRVKFVQGRFGISGSVWEFRVRLGVQGLTFRFKTQGLEVQGLGSSGVLEVQVLEVQVLEVQGLDVPRLEVQGLEVQGWNVQLLDGSQVESSPMEVHWLKLKIAFEIPSGFCLKFPSRFRLKFFEILPGLCLKCVQREVRARSVWALSVFGESRVGFEDPSRLGLGLKVLQGSLRNQRSSWKFRLGLEVQASFGSSGLVWKFKGWFGHSLSGVRLSEVRLGVLVKVRSSFRVGSDVFRVGFEVQGWF